MNPGDVTPLDLSGGLTVLAFVGAGMSAESGVPTYRGAGGIWGQYDYREFACQRAFDRDPQKVLDFHELRRRTTGLCAPHAGHDHLRALQTRWPGQLRVVTQNIDGLLQRAGVAVDVELHGSLWRLRCLHHGVFTDHGPDHFARRDCPHCGQDLRPDITWFEDAVDQQAFATAARLVTECDVLLSIGTSAVVYPAAGFIEQAWEQGKTLIELNPEASELAHLFRQCLRLPASQGLPALLPLTGQD